MDNSQLERCCGKGPVDNGNNNGEAMRRKDKISCCRAKMTVRGMTLVELLITSVILLLLLGIFVWMIVAVKSAYQSSVSRIKVRQELQTSFFNITREMMNSSYSSFTDGTSHTAKSISFLSAFDQNGVFVTDSNGAPIWKKYVIYYVPSGSARLLKKEVYGTFTTSLSSEALAAYCDGGGRLITNSLSQMACTPDPATKSCLLSLVMESTNYNGKADRQSGEMRVFFRN
ncbi:MAG: PilW family protein [Candidatus Xenobiia bacterium LiM19]